MRVLERTVSCKAVAVSRKAVAVGLVAFSCILALGSPRSDGALTVAPAWAASCPPEMAHLGNYCIDRWEVHAVEAKSGLRLSPYYPPEPRLLSIVYRYWSSEAARNGDARARKLALPFLPGHQRKAFSPKAVAAEGVLPQGYMTYYSAKLACENAGKRLCSEEEWVGACRGSKGTRHPYGDSFQAGKCNVFRAVHPAYELHGNSSLGHLDPRLHLVTEEGDIPLLFATGHAKACVSKTRDGDIFDMEGNLDEWIDDPEGVFVGGFFSRQTREGCAAKIDNHAPAYTDYSLGTRCCKTAR